MRKPCSNCINLIVDRTDNLTPQDPGMTAAITTTHCHVDFDGSSSSLFHCSFVNVEEVTAVNET